MLNRQFIGGDDQMSMEEEPGEDGSGEEYLSGYFDENQILKPNQNPESSTTSSLVVPKPFILPKKKESSDLTPFKYNASQKINTSINLLSRIKPFRKKLIFHIKQTSINPLNNSLNITHTPKQDIKTMMTKQSSDPSQSNGSSTGKILHTNLKSKLTSKSNMDELFKQQNISKIAENLNSNTKFGDKSDTHAKKSEIPDFTKSITNINDESTWYEEFSRELDKEIERALNMNVYLFSAPISALALAGQIGNPGQPGITGQKGKEGYPGNPGFHGPDGPSGLVGMTGLPGEEGQSGKTGDRGPIGPPGDMGLPGDIGLQGIRGNPGRPGIQGESGKEAIFPNCTYVCQNEKLWIQCREYEVVHIIRSFWGRDSFNICPIAPANMTSSKLCEGSQDMVYLKSAEQCGGKRACELVASNMFFDDNTFPE
ncbi:hypothetical protein HZS_521, partial [Henneguya salminicola]